MFAANVGVLARASYHYSAKLCAIYAASDRAVSNAMATHRQKQQHADLPCILQQITAEYIHIRTVQYVCVARGSLASPFVSSITGDCRRNRLASTLGNGYRH